MINNMASIDNKTKVGAGVVKVALKWQGRQGRGCHLNVTIVFSRENNDIIVSFVAPAVVDPAPAAVMFIVDTAVTASIVTASKYVIHAVVVGRVYYI